MKDELVRTLVTTPILSVQVRVIVAVESFIIDAGEKEPKEQVGAELSAKEALIVTEAETVKDAGFVEPEKPEDQLENLNPELGVAVAEIFSPYLAVNVLFEPLAVAVTPVVLFSLVTFTEPFPPVATVIVYSFLLNHAVYVAFAVIVGLLVSNVDAVVLAAPLLVPTYVPPVGVV